MLRNVSHINTVQSISHFMSTSFFPLRIYRYNFFFISFFQTLAISMKKQFEFMCVALILWPNTKKKNMMRKLRKRFIDRNCHYTWWLHLICRLTLIRNKFDFMAFKRFLPSIRIVCNRTVCLQLQNRKMA